MTKSNSKNFVSFVVDAIPRHYFQAELLLLSLEHFAKHTKENILVQCVNRVDKNFINFLEKNSYQYRIIEPFLDGKYCNKLQQLEAFIDKECDGVFLLDTDMFVLEPFLSNYNCFAAKIVDAPNPPLPVIEKIFSAAGITLPEIVQNDWVQDNNKTIATNFNGGFYYVPVDAIQEINHQWRKWATWLHLKPDLFENDSQRIHVDQVSMALCIAESGLDFLTLNSNDNFPTHSNKELSLFLTEKPISILHYHNLISHFGLLDKSKINNPKVINAINKANHLISKTQRFVFFKDYKKSNIKLPHQTQQSIEFKQKIKKLIKPFGRKIKLILHAGTPKSGTTSLQFHMKKNQENLKANGILYPNHFLQDVYAPKHQWLVQDLRSANADKLVENIKIIINQVDIDTHTIFLSTEGIFNHWWDFPEESKSLLVELSNCFDVALWICLRDPISFAESYYKQNIKNPQIPSVNCYGKDLSFEDMIKDEWFIRHFDYLGFICECEILFGKGSVESFEYTNDVIQTIYNKLGFTSLAIEKEPRENSGLSTAATNLIRVINRYPLSPLEKKKTLIHIKSLNNILSNHSSEDLFDEKSKNTLLEMTALVNFINFK